jgi:hypothetical protein
MVGTIGGTVSSFHLKTYSVRRSRPLREGTEVIFGPRRSVPKGPFYEVGGP